MIDLQTQHALNDRWTVVTGWVDMAVLKLCMLPQTPELRLVIDWLCRAQGERDQLQAHLRQLGVLPHEWPPPT